VHLRDEPIALPGDCLNVSWFQEAVPQDLSNLTDGLFDCVNFLPAAPNFAQQLGFRDHAVPIPDEELQGCERLRGEPKLLGAAV